MADPARETPSPALPRGLAREGGDAAKCLYLRPLEWPRPQRFEVLVRSGNKVVSAIAPISAIIDWAHREGPELGAHATALVERMAAPPAAFAGLSLERPLVMGIVNVTPDSFHDGGKTATAPAALARGREMLAAGADMIDVGGESSRPGASPVSPGEEASRVLPVVEALAAEGAVVSIDTRRAAVMEAALQAGARIVNDISALTGDERSPEVLAASDASVILMHMRGQPATMQDGPRYGHAALDVYDYLADRVAACEAAGIGRRRLAVDPGIGFGKTLEHNLDILGRLTLYHGLGCPLALGVSRKSFIAGLSRDEEPGERLSGSLAAALAAAARGAGVLRVHDVAETRQALAVWQAVAAAGTDCKEL